MEITMIGTGYVGLVTGACFSEMGNLVTCIDVDEEKVKNLKKGVMPIYEKGLEEIVKKNYSNGFLKFETKISYKKNDIALFFIAVGTPPKEDGSADLSYVLTVAKEIGQNIKNKFIVVTKSTVPVGTAELVKKTIQNCLNKRNKKIAFEVVSNPEFLREGVAVEDFMKPDRIIIGAESQKAFDVMKDLYAPFSRNREKIHFMGLRDAELTKYVANAMLATKISFMNEISLFCDKLNIDIENVRKGIGADSRIGYAFIYPGCGYGGSCFPKDVKALINVGKKNKIEPLILNAVENVNKRQKLVIFEKLLEYFKGDIKNKKIAVWGLAFKPGTDDIREAPSLVLIDKVINAGGKIVAYDPVASDNIKKEFAPKFFKEGKIVLKENQYDVLEGSDALCLLTEWKSFRQVDFDLIKKKMKVAVIFDGRNQYAPNKLKALGIDYFGIGRKS